MQMASKGNILSKSYFSRIEIGDQLLLFDDLMLIIFVGRLGLFNRFQGGKQEEKVEAGKRPKDVNGPEDVRREKMKRKTRERVIKPGKREKTDRREGLGVRR